ANSASPGATIYGGSCAGIAPDTSDRRRSRFCRRWPAAPYSSPSHPWSATGPCQRYLIFDTLGNNLVILSRLQWVRGGAMSIDSEVDLVRQLSDPPVYLAPADVSRGGTT